MKKLKLLLVDDDKIDRMRYQRILSKSTKFKYIFGEASSAQQGIELYLNKAIDCVLLDYLMPDMHGLDFIKKIKQHTSEPLKPIIMLTGEGDERVAVGALKEGVVDYLVKDNITPESLEQAICDAIAEHKLTIKAKKNQHKLKEQAQKDPLTNLLNRRAFNDIAHHLLLNAERHKAILAFLFIDLDGFKAVNDTHGHIVGDFLIKEVAARLNQTVRKGDVIARIGGDEFAIILNRVKSTNASQAIANKIINHISKEYKIDELIIRISTSIGIAHFPHTANNLTDLMKCADHALYQAKQAGRNNFQCFSLKNK